MPINAQPHCSVIIPCRNEVRFIGLCLDSILANTYPHDKLEVIVVDGMSDDGTRDVLRDCAERHPIVRVFDNQKRFTPSALNIAIANAKGKIILRVDAHNIYAHDYISRCVAILESSGADCVGGVCKTKVRDDTAFASGFELVMTHPLGVGNSKFRIGVKTPQWVDAVAFGCMRKTLFSKVGLFNEELHRSQDMDFWSRVRQADGRILLDPSIQSVHLARGTLKAVASHYFVSGFWVTWPMRVAGTRFAFRHLAPLAFCLFLLAASVGGVAWRPIWAIEAAVLSVYALALVTVSMAAAVRRWDWTLPFTGPVAFAVVHLSYGFGSICGMLKPMRSTAKGPAPLPAPFTDT